MTVEEKEIAEIVIIKNTPILKPIELKNIGFLQQQPVLVNCPACDAEALSVVRLESVTCLQRFLNATNLCKNWTGRRDINHYCSKCGCYIGRYVALGCSDRCLSYRARKLAAKDRMTLKTRSKDCAVIVQQGRERVLADLAAAKAEKEARETTETVVQEQSK